MRVSHPDEDEFHAQPLCVKFILCGMRHAHGLAGGGDQAGGRVVVQVGDERADDDARRGVQRVDGGVGGGTSGLSLSDATLTLFTPPLLAWLKMGM